MGLSGDEIMAGLMRTFRRFASFNRLFPPTAETWQCVKYFIWEWLEFYCGWWWWGGLSDYDNYDDDDYELMMLMCCLRGLAMALTVAARCMWSSKGIVCFIVYILYCILYIYIVLWMNEYMLYCISYICIWLSQKLKTDTISLSSLHLCTWSEQRMFVCRLVYMFVCNSIV